MTSLRQRMIEDMQIRNLAVHTQNTYVLLDCPISCTSEELV